MLTQETWAASSQKNTRANPSKKRKETTNPKTSIEIVNRFIGYEYVHLQEEERYGRIDPVESAKSKVEHPQNHFRQNTETPQRRQVSNQESAKPLSKANPLNAASLKIIVTKFFKAISSDT
ncbi:hypothetical protein Dimus_031139 [Dionaea muscipula]